MVKKNPNKADMLVFKALQKAVEQDRLRVYLDYAKINKPQSPVYDPWECLLPILVPVILGLILIIGVGVLFGLLFMVIMILAYSTYVKKKVHRRLVERTKRFLTDSFDNCVRLWEFGGIVLVNARDKRLGCVAPEGDWKDFVVLNYADLMVENNTHEKSKENTESTAENK